MNKLHCVNPALWSFRLLIELAPNCEQVKMTMIGLDDLPRDMLRYNIEDLIKRIHDRIAKRGNDDGSETMAHSSEDDL